MMEDERAPFGTMARRVAEAAGEEAALHVELARAELTRDVDQLRRTLTPLVVALPMALTGYALLCGALASWVATWLGTPLSLLGVGVLNLVVGGGLGWRAASRFELPALFRQPFGAEVRESLSAAGAAFVAPRAEPGGRGRSDGR